MIRSEKTRQYIIEKTASIFNKKGYTGTYLSDLTEATGLTKGSIYGNFKDKDEVALEVFRYNYKQLAAEIELKLKKAERSDEKLLAFLSYYKTEYRNIFEKGGCALLNTAIDSDDGNETLKKAVTESLLSWRDRLETILEQGIQMKELKRINKRDFSNKMISLIEGTVMLAKTLNEPQIVIKNIEFLEQEVKELSIK